MSKIEYFTFPSRIDLNKCLKSKAVFPNSYPGRRLIKKLTSRFCGEKVSFLELYDQTTNILNTKGMRKEQLHLERILIIDALKECKQI